MSGGWILRGIITKMGKKSDSCACGVKSKVHRRKSRRNQLPPLRTNRYGYPIKRKKPVIKEYDYEWSMFSHWLED